jgi:hypothetical protein
VIILNIYYQVVVTLFLHMQKKIKKNNDINLFKNRKTIKKEIFYFSIPRRLFLVFFFLFQLILI